MTMETWTVQRPTQKNHRTIWTAIQHFCMCQSACVIASTPRQTTLSMVKYLQSLLHILHNAQTPTTDAKYLQCTYVDLLHGR